MRVDEKVAQKVVGRAEKRVALMVVLERNLVDLMVESRVEPKVSKTVGWMV